MLDAILQKREDFSILGYSFLSHLGAILSSSMKHVVIPSTIDGATIIMKKSFFSFISLLKRLVND